MEHLAISSTLLGQGGAATVFLGTHKEVPAAVARIPQKLFNEPAFNLLAEVPEDKRLLARPFCILKTPEFTYLIEPLLKSQTLNHTPSLFAVVHGLKKMASALTFLHAKGFVHGDPTLENGTYEGLFDYGTLTRIGAISLIGATLTYQPPEVIKQRIPLLSADPSRQARYQAYLDRLSLPPSLEASKGASPSSDVYIFGKQIERLYPKFPALKKLIPLVTSMLDIDASKRPSMTEIATELAVFEKKLTKEKSCSIL